ncbi:MAG: hypothetical protein ACI86H_002280 [bacterium]
MHPHMCGASFPKSATVLYMLDSSPHVWGFYLIKKLIN